MVDEIVRIGMWVGGIIVIAVAVFSVGAVLSLLLATVTTNVNLQIKILTIILWLMGKRSKQDTPHRSE